MRDLRTFNAPTREGLQEKLDEIIATGRPFKDIPLVLPATGNSSRSTYRDFTIRYWRGPHGDRYDTCVNFD